MDICAIIKSSFLYIMLYAKHIFEIGGMLPTVISITVSVSIILLFTTLYYFSIRSVVATWISFAFLIFDTIALIIFAYYDENISSFLINFAFHSWILWSIQQLAVSKNKLTQLTLSKISLHEKGIGLS